MAALVVALKSVDINENILFVYFLYSLPLGAIWTLEALIILVVVITSLLKSTVARARAPRTSSVYDPSVHEPVSNVVSVSGGGRAGNKNYLVLSPTPVSHSDESDGIINCADFRDGGRKFLTFMNT